MQANKQQQRAIAHNTGPALILAGPGSGKTFTTVERVRYLIEVHHADPSHILVITFTKAAARQMRDRFFARMDNQFFPVTFGTFHAVFFHILKTSCHYDGSSILKEKEKREYLAIRFTYPEKFWKISNMYYHSNKAWVPEKSTEKLKKAIYQTEEKKRFLANVFALNV